LKNTILRALLILLLFALPSAHLLGQTIVKSHDSNADTTSEARAARMKWWTEARFGMFIHWDMSSIAGTEISWSRKSTRPLDVDKAPAGYVEDPFYDHLYERFNPTNFNAKEWVRLAQAAGMKYIVFTAKHHGGFCMWDTKLTDYSILHTPFKRDVVKELADACHQAGMRFGLYYSPRDWHQPDYGLGDNANYTAYMKGQLTELLTRYGKIDCLWFDGFGAGDSIQFWHADEMLALIKKLQPLVIINNRLANIWFPGNINSTVSSYSALGDMIRPKEPSVLFKMIVHGKRVT
jgi:alpha-L-fucosidase